MSGISDKYDRLTVKLAVLLLAPHTWAASLMPALFAVLYGYLFIEGFRWYKGVFLIIACALLQGTVNALNDYFDYKKGVDSSEDNVEVNDAVLVYNNLNPKSVKNLIIGTFLTAVILCSISAIGAGYVPFVTGIIGAVIIYTYSGGKLPISYLPIGELVSGFVMGGLIPVGVVSCFDGRFHAELLLLGIPFIIGIGLIMMSNNGCDIEKDEAAGRKTLPVLLGRGSTLILYRVLIVIWAASAGAVSYMIGNRAGLLTCLFCLAVGYMTIAKLFRLGLEPETRVTQMKTVNKSNYIVNGSVVIALAVLIVVEILNA